jgi:hypothetical protein
MFKKPTGRSLAGSTKKEQTRSVVEDISTSGARLALAQAVDTLQLDMGAILCFSCGREELLEAVRAERAARSQGRQKAAAATTIQVQKPVHADPRPATCKAAVPVADQQVDLLVYL